MDTFIELVRLGVRSRGGEVILPIPEHFPRTAIPQLETFCAHQLNHNFGGVPFTVKSYAASASELDKQRQYNFELAIAFSGGMDSTIAALYAIHLGYRDIALVNCNYGAVYNRIERRAITNLFDSALITLPVIDLEVQLDLPYDQWILRKGYIIAGRNCMLASLAAVYSRNVWLVANWRADDEQGACDKNRRFFGEMSQFLSLGLKRPIQVSSPFLHWTKKRMLEWAANTLTTDSLRTLIDKTVSCYSGTNLCGQCYSCFKKYNVVLAVFGKEEVMKLPWVVDPANSPMYSEYSLMEHRKRG